MSKNFTPPYQQQRENQAGIVLIIIIILIMYDHENMLFPAMVIRLCNTRIIVRMSEMLTDSWIMIMMARFNGIISSILVCTQSNAQQVPLSVYISYMFIFLLSPARELEFLRLEKERKKERNEDGKDHDQLDICMRVCVRINEIGIFSAKREAEEPFRTGRLTV